MSEKYIIPIFVPHLGCPNNCTFCNQKSISGQMKNVTAEEVRKTIESFLKSFKNNEIEKEIAFFGGSFTGIETKIQEELLSVAYEYVKNGVVTGIRVSTRPDYIDKEKLKLLKKYGVKTVELGVQSTNDYILKKCKRGHTFEDVKKASKLIRRFGFILGHQMMVGLPESTRLDELNTAKDLAKLKPKIIRLYPVLVIKNTKLEKEFLDEKYTPLTVVQAVETCKELEKKSLETVYRQVLLFCLLGLIKRVPIVDVPKNMLIRAKKETASLKEELSAQGEKGKKRAEAVRDINFYTIRLFFFYKF